MLPDKQIQQIRARAEEGHAASQFLLSQIYQQGNDLENMIVWLQTAAANNVPDALDALGYCFEKGSGISQDYDAALARYDQAVMANCRHAAYRRAELLFKSTRSSAETGNIRDSLIAAANADVVLALRTIGYLSVQSTDSRDFGMRCLRRAALLGDVVARYNLASCLLRNSGDSERSEAVYWLQHAVRENYPLADTLLASTGNMSTTVAFVPVDAPIGPVQPFALQPSRPDPDFEAICDNPPITMFHNVLSEIDRAYLMFLARPSLVRANVINPSSETAGLVSDVRTSTSTYLPYLWVDIIGRFIELKIALATGEDLAHSEPMSILRYEPGQYYRPHVDYFNPKLKVSEALLQDGGQRTASAVTYLTTPASGGSTSFPKLNITLPAVAGSCLWFRNCDDEGQTTDRSLHAGDAVTSGEKWVVTKWFRQKPTSYFEY